MPKLIGNAPNQVPTNADLGTMAFEDKINYLKNGRDITVDSSQNVGIGTTAPDALLSVNGVASFGDGTAAAPSVANFGDLDTGMFFPAADTIAFSEGGVEAMRITSNNQLLIGTTVTPASANTKLSVHLPINTSGANAIEISHNTNGANKAGAALGLTIGNGGAATNAANLYFETASGGSLSRRMTIDSSGALLLGTTTAGSASAGDLVVNGGVFLGGTGTANKLDDYEEGTWTPTLETGTLTSDASGYYTKIGRLVYINFIAGGFSNTSSTSDVKINNLPFTNSSFVGSNDNYGYVMSRYLNISDQSITGYIAGGNSTMIFYINGNAGASDNWISVKHNQIGSGAYFRVGAVYLTDA